MKKYAVICDKLMWENLKNYENFKLLTFSNYFDLLKEVDALLYFSTWSGPDDIYLVKNQKFQLLSIMKIFKSHGKKIAFLSKEDPDYFEFFKDFAIDVDNIFTTASECINLYKHISNAEVDVFTYPIDIDITNPIGSFSKSKNSTVFMGAYYPAFPKRYKSFKTIATGFIDSNVKFTIYDRFYGNKKHEFPVEMREFVKKSLTPIEVIKKTKKIDNHISLSTVITSPTMTCVRNYQLQFMLKRIFSNYSLAVSTNFPSINIIPTSDVVKIKLDNINRAYEMYSYASVARNLYSKSTTNEFLVLLEEKLFSSKVDRKMKIGIISTESVAANFPTQTYKNYEFCLPENKFKYDAYIELNEKDTYSPFFLEELQNAYSYSLNYRISKVALCDTIEDSYTISSINSYNIALNINNNYSNTLAIYNNVILDKLKEKITYKYEKSLNVKYVTIVVDGSKDIRVFRDRLLKSLTGFSNFLNYNLIYLYDNNEENYEFQQEIMSELKYLFDNITFEKKTKKLKMIELEIKTPYTMFLNAHDDFLVDIYDCDLNMDKMDTHIIFNKYILNKTGKLVTTRNREMLVEARGQLFLTKIIANIEVEFGNPFGFTELNKIILKSNNYILSDIINIIMYDDFYNFDISSFDDKIQDIDYFMDRIVQNITNETIYNNYLQNCDVFSPNRKLFNYNDISSNMKNLKQEYQKNVEKNQKIRTSSIYKLISVLK